MRITITAVLSAIIILSSCKKDDLLTSTQELYESNEYVSSDLAGTEWVITKYQNAAATEASYPNDTISFETQNSYRINGSSVREYQLKKSDNDEFSLYLYDCVTLGGDYRMYGQNIFLTDGILNNIGCDNLHVLSSHSHSTTLVWMEKIN